MKFQKYFFIFFLFLFAYSYGQDWKTYPYTPTGSLISFSIDEGRHPTEETEWWYTTGHVIGNTTDNKYSYMLTYFYNPALGYDGFRIFNVTNDDTGENLFDTQPVKYDVLGTDSLNIEVSNSPLKNLEIWKNKLDSNNKTIPFEYVLSASSDNAEINLQYETIKRPLILGGDGKFDQGSSSYTYYYSQTKNNVIGTITFKGVTEDVTGTSWIDRQYGSYNGRSNEKYEWFSIQLSNGMDINLWNLFTSEHEIPDSLNFRILSAYIDENTQYTTKEFYLERLEFNFTTDMAICYSKKWRLTSSLNNIDLIITVLHDDSEVQLPFRFYEGATSIAGTVNGVSVTGQGFAELLHSYEKPDVSFTHPIDGSFNSSDHITWNVNNSDEGNPLFFDVSYSIDNKQTFKTIAEGISDTFYYWNNPDITTGENIWFKITAYSIDKTLLNSIISTNSSFTLPVQQFNKNEIILFPNPSSKEFLIKLSQNTPSLDYQIIDLNGKIIKEDKVKNISVLKIETQNFKPGLYFIKLNSDNKTMQSKFLVK